MRGRGGLLLLLHLDLFTTSLFSFIEVKCFRIVIRRGFEQIIFKMDRHGNGERVELEKVFSAESCKPSFRSFDLKLFTGSFFLLFVECND